MKYLILLSLLCMGCGTIEQNAPERTQLDCKPPTTDENGTINIDCQP